MSCLYLLCLAPIRDTRGLLRTRPCGERAEKSAKLLSCLSFSQTCKPLRSHDLGTGRRPFPRSLSGLKFQVFGNSLLTKCQRCDSIKFRFRCRLGSCSLPQLTTLSPLAADTIILASWTCKHRPRVLGGGVLQPVNGRASLGPMLGDFKAESKVGSLALHCWRLMPGDCTARVWLLPGAVAPAGPAGLQDHR